MAEGRDGNKYDSILRGRARSLKAILHKSTATVKIKEAYMTGYCRLVDELREGEITYHDSLLA